MIILITGACLKLKSVRNSPGAVNGIGEFDHECGCKVLDDIYPDAIPVEHKSELSMEPEIYEKIKG